MRDKENEQGIRHVVASPRHPRAFVQRNEAMHLQQRAGGSAV